MMYISELRQQEMEGVLVCGWVGVSVAVSLLKSEMKNVRHEWKLSFE